MFDSIARRQFVPTNCAQLPSFDCRGDKTVITPFSSVSVRELSNNKSSIMINFQRNLKGKAARWQQQNKEEQRMNKTEFIKVRCTLEEKQRIKSKAESAGRKFSDYCREILLNGEVAAVPKMTDNEKEAIAILQHTGRFYGQVSNLIKVKDERWVHITKNLSLCAKEAFKRFYNPHFRVDDEIYKVLNLKRDDR